MVVNTETNKPEEEHDKLSSDEDVSEYCWAKEKEVRFLSKIEEMDERCKIFEILEWPRWKRRVYDGDIDEGDVYLAESNGRGYGRLVVVVYKQIYEQDGVLRPFHIGVLGIREKKRKEECILVTTPTNKCPSWKEAQVPEIGQEGASSSERFRGECILCLSRKPPTRTISSSMPHNCKLKPATESPYLCPAISPNANSKATFL